jgi:ubiquinol-cytochrome c reductase cytochrome b subunit
MNFLLDWLDERVGIRKLIHESLYENIPSGARVRYISGSMLVFAFVTQAVTGIFLWMAYSPSSQTAWESVYYIEHQMAGGSLMRGIHHFMAQAMVVLLPFHLLQVVIDGAYRKPREANFWFGLILMQIVMGLGLTGYLLPWDQKGYWATNVATNLMTLVPVFGAQLQQLVIGGTEYGHHTLTRFFAMHTGVLPAVLVAFLGLHIALFRRHGITAKITPGRRDQYFWPHQVMYDAVGCLLLLLIVTALAWRVGAELGAPADPAQSYSAARPEWYYLFLFQLLKYFHGSSEIVGAIIIPGAVVAALFAMPIVGRSRIGHALNVAFIGVLLSAAGVLTALALREDNFEAYARWTGLDAAKLAALPEAEREQTEKLLRSAQEFRLAKEQAEREAHRAVQLVERREMVDGRLSAPLMIPRQGAVYLLRNDPMTQGPRLFGRHCASCHDYAAEAVASAASDSESQVEFRATQLPRVKDPAARQPVVARGTDGQVQFDPPPPGAPNLYRFASRAWIQGLLDKDQISKLDFVADPADAANGADNPESHRRRIVAPYFGNTAHRDGRMATWVKQHLAKIDPDELKEIVVALSAQARLRDQRQEDQADQEQIARGVLAIEKNCANGCHKFGEHGQFGLAPDLTGYGSYEWMMAFVSDPMHARFYRQENDRMPSFAANLADPASHSLSIAELSLIVDWIRGEYYRADDAEPVLPHSEEYARHVVALGRGAVPESDRIVGRAPKTLDDPRLAEAIFRKNCAACHNHLDPKGKGIAATHTSAANLYHFGSREWLAGLLTHPKIASDEYFGATAHFESDMADFVRDNLRDLDEPRRAALNDLIVALSSEARLAYQRDADAQAMQQGTIERGRAALAESFSCTDCHKFYDQGDLGSAPDLTGWGSEEWLTELIRNPGHSRFYDARNDRMPAFATGRSDRPGLLTEEEIFLLVRWLRGQ